MNLINSIGAAWQRAATWLREKLGPAPAEAPEFSRLKSQVQDSERNLASFDFGDITDAHGLSKNIEDYVALRGTHLHLLGCLEGNLNVNLDGIDARIRAYAYSLRNIVVHHCRLLKVKVESEIKEIDTVTAKLRGELVVNEQYLAELEAARKQHPGNFSLPMGWFYVIAGLVLLLADLPLSLMAMRNLVPAPDKAADLVWAQRIISIGITLIPLSVKLFMDKYIISHRKANIQSRSAKEWAQVGLWYGPEFVLQLLVLIAVVCNLFALGYARHLSIKPPVQLGKKPSDENVIRIKNHILKFDNILTNPDPETVKFISFLFLSVLFPLLSGLLLSYGLFYLSNGYNLTRVKLNVAKLGNSIAKLDKNNAQKEGEKSVVLERIYQWEETENNSLVQMYHLNFIEAYKTGFVLCNGNSSSRYHVMYRKYLRSFAIAQFIKSCLLCWVLVSSYGCIRESSIDNASTKRADSVDVKVLCDFTLNKNAMMIENISHEDTSSRVLAFSYDLLKECFEAKVPNSRVAFYAVLETNGDNKLAQFVYPAAEPATTDDEERLANDLITEYQQLEHSAHAYLRNPAKRTCLFNSIRGLYSPIKYSATNKSLEQRRVKIVILSDRLEMCNGVRLEGTKNLGRDTIDFDTKFPQVPDFSSLGVEFLFITTGRRQHAEEIAANNFWEHVLVRFGYPRQVARNMSLGIDEVPGNVFPSLAVDN